MINIILNEQQQELLKFILETEMENGNNSEKTHIICRQLINKLEEKND